MIVLKGELEPFIICCFNKFSQFWTTQTAAHSATGESLQVLSIGSVADVKPHQALEAWQLVWK